MTHKARVQSCQEAEICRIPLYNASVVWATMGVKDGRAIGLCLNTDITAVYLYVTRGESS